MKILTIIAALFLLSCSKDKAKCWECVARTPVLKNKIPKSLFIRNHPGSCFHRGFFIIHT